MVSFSRLSLVLESKIVSARVDVYEDDIITHDHRHFIAKNDQSLLFDFERLYAGNTPQAEGEDH